MCGVLCKVVHILAALGSVYVGLLALGHDLFSMLGLSAISHASMYVFGIAGLLSLIMQFACCMKPECRTK